MNQFRDDFIYSNNFNFFFFKEFKWNLSFIFEEWRVPTADRVSRQWLGRAMDGRETAARNELFPFTRGNEK